MEPYPEFFDKLLEDLYPLNRSLTGIGNRNTLKIISDIIDLKIHEVPTNTPIFDWVVPKEWNIKSAWIADENQNKIIDFDVNNLHILGYSIAVDRVVTFTELKNHLFVHSCPEAIPYRTSYYEKNWGFCVTQKQYDTLKQHKGKLHVHIDADHNHGSLTYGTKLIKGNLNKEVLLSCYICHPSMANDSLSGVVLAVGLAKYLLRKSRLKRSYRFVFAPETLGALAFCNNHLDEVKNALCGFVLTTCGGPGKMGMKRSFDYQHFVNQISLRSLMKLETAPKIYDFDIHGSDERQYSSPGIGLNCITITKDKYYTYKGYHSSLDDLDFVKGDHIFKVFQVYTEILDGLEKEIFFQRHNPHGEPMLSKYGLYQKLGGSFVPENAKLTSIDIYLWLLFFANGSTPLSEISGKLKVPDEIIFEHYQKLVMEDLIYEV